MRITNRCRECGKEMQGRTDKKYCSDNCRSEYHNKRYRDQKSIFSPIDKKLHKNRAILVKASSGRGIITAKRLLDMGFDFRYHTQTYLSESGLLYKYCYDTGYVFITGNSIHITKLTYDPLSSTTSSEELRPSSSMPTAADLYKTDNCPPKGVASSKGNDNAR